jgi:hypothetical protein
MQVHELEALFAGDLHEVAPERFMDEKFCRDLYRALAGRRWFKGGEEGYFVMSWSQAAELVNEMRRLLAGYDPLPLFQTGGEGEVSDLVDRELRLMGWFNEPEDTTERDPAHTWQPEEHEPPTGDVGKRFAPTTRTPPERHKTFVNRGDREGDGPSGPPPTP